ncbi:MAG: ketoacyl-ACP synthase III [Oscillospiraceae bacterium]|nr:ketoacyl-ACP synthase III [Oscillospiraceae bacterium]
MNIIKKINSVILGTGSYLPEFVIDNAVFNQTVETNDDWITSRTGIKERRAEQEKYNFEMVGEACGLALKNSGISPLDIDMVIVSTATPDYSCPSVACLVQNYIGAHNSMSFDIAAGCAGFIFAVDIADVYIKSGRAKNILVASGDIMTRLTDYFDRSSCILFGDGAGAMVVSATETEKSGDILATYIKCECDNNKPYFIQSPLYKPAEIFDKTTKRFKGNSKRIVADGYLKQNGREVMQFVARVIPIALNKVLDKAGKKTEDLKYIIAHQANKRILDYVIDKYKLDREKVPINIEKYGNMSTSTISVLLHELNSSGKLERGDLIALVGFGAGLAYGAALIRW